MGLPNKGISTQITPIWEVVVYLGPSTYHDTFRAAFIHLYKEVKKQLESGNTSAIALYQGTWIKVKQLSAGPMFFCDARDEAYRQGIITIQGDLVEIDTNI